MTHEDDLIGDPYATPAALAAERPAPARAPKMSFRVSGARAGSVARPADDGSTKLITGERFGVRAVDPAGPRRFGLRVNGTRLAPDPAKLGGTEEP